MAISKNGRNDNWEQKWQECQPMSAWYKTHHKSKPHLAKIWYLLETEKYIPSTRVLAQACNTTQKVVAHVFSHFREAGGKLERQGNGRGYTRTMPKVKKLAPVAMPQLELVTEAPQELPALAPEQPSDTATIIAILREQNNLSREILAELRKWS